VLNLGFATQCANDSLAWGWQRRSLGLGECALSFISAKQCVSTRQGVLSTVECTSVAPLHAVAYTKRAMLQAPHATKLLRNRQKAATKYVAKMRDSAQYPTLCRLHAGVGSLLQTNRKHPACCGAHSKPPQSFVHVTVIGRPLCKGVTCKSATCRPWRPS
jgi:hypothetical protein